MNSCSNMGSVSISAVHPSTAKLSSGWCRHVHRIQGRMVFAQAYVSVGVYFMRWRYCTKPALHILTCGGKTLYYSMLVNGCLLTWSLLVSWTASPSHQWVSPCLVSLYVDFIVYPHVFRLYSESLKARSPRCLFNQLCPEYYHKTSVFWVLRWCSMCVLWTCFKCWMYRFSTGL